MLFEIVGEITQVETIAVGTRIRDLPGSNDSTDKVGGGN